MTQQTLSKKNLTSYELAERKFDGIQSMLDKLKGQESGKKEAFVSLFKESIQTRYRVIYQEDKSHILQELKSLEKSTFIKEELFNLADMMQNGKQKCNEIRHRVSLRKAELQHQRRQLDKYSRGVVSEEDLVLLDTVS